MSKTLDRLCARKLFQPPPEAWDRGTIVVEGEDPARSFNESQCLIGVDGRRVAVLAVLSPKAEFTVPVGDHQVTVRLGPDLSEALPIRVEAGEEVHLVCGKRAEWKEMEWSITRQMFVPACVSLGLLALIWIVHPVLQPIVASTLPRWVSIGWFGPLPMVLRERFMAAVTLSQGVFLPFFVHHIGRWFLETRRLGKELGPRCYVAFRGSQAPKQKPPIDDWDLE